MSAELKQQIADLLPRLRRFAVALTGSRDEAEDLLQASCLKALTRLDQFQEGTRLDSWMFRILQTGWIDRTRAARIRAPAPPEALEALHDHGLGARAAEDRLELAKLRADVAALPPEQRAVLALVAIDGLSYREAAETLDVPMGTVMSRLARARRKLLAARGERLERLG